MSTLLSANIENAKEQQQKCCFPKRKSLKCLMKRSSHITLRPLNAQNFNKKAKLKQQQQEKKEILVPTEEVCGILGLPTDCGGNPKKRDVQLCRELLPDIFDFKLYSQDTWKALMQIERNWKWPKPNYMRKQPQLNVAMRRMLIDWLVLVQDEHKMDSQCLHLAVSFIDRFLTSMSVEKSKFQLLGAAAMFVAGKLEEVYPPLAKEWADLTCNTFTKEQVKRMERILLSAIGFDVQPPTALTFIQHLCREFDVDTRVLYLAMYLSELMLIEDTNYLKYLPSQIASSAVALARITVTREKVWPKKFKSYSRYSLKQLSPVVQKQQEIFVESPTKPQQAIQDKYKSPKYGCVSFLRPVSLNLDEIEDDDDQY